MQKSTSYGAFVSFLSENICHEIVLSFDDFEQFRNHYLTGNPDKSGVTAQNFRNKQYSLVRKTLGVMGKIRIVLCGNIQRVLYLKHV